MSNRLATVFSRFVTLTDIVSLFKLNVNMSVSVLHVTPNALV